MLRYIFIAVLSLFLTKSSYAQCDPLSLKGQAINNLEKGFTYIKSFPLNDEKLNNKNEIEYSFVFSKGTKYILSFVDEEGKIENVNIELFDPNKSLIAKNKKGGKLIPLSYTCNATGVHYMKFSFNGNKNHCSLAILSFKR